MKPTVIFIRHVSTAKNSAGRGAEPERIRGQSDPPPIPEGIRQAQEVSQKLANVPLDEIYTTPLQRGAVLAVAVQKANSGKPKLTPMKELLPWDTGKLTDEEVRKTVPVVLKYEIDSPNVSPGSGKGYKGEPYNVFKRRCLGATQEILDYAKRDKKVCLVVWHSRNMDLLEAWQKAGMRGMEIDTQVLRDALEGKNQLGTGDGWVYEFDGKQWKDREVDFADKP